MKISFAASSLLLASALMTSAYAQDKPAAATSPATELPAELSGDPQRTRALYQIGVLGYSIGTFSQCKSANKEMLSAFERELIRATAVEAAALKVTTAEIKQVYVAAVKEGKTVKPAPTLEQCNVLKEGLEEVKANMATVK